MDTERLKQKLEQNSNKQSDSDCWLWTGQISNSGRGRITIKDPQSGSNKMVSAETASYLAHNGELKQGQLVRQRCNNRLCINPEHLEVLNISDLHKNGL